MTQNRRQFLFGMAPLVLPAAVLARGGAVAPSNRVTVAMIGMGRQAMQVNVKQFFEMPDVQVVAVCDVDAWRLANAKRQVEEAYAQKAPSGGYKGCLAYKNFREVLANKSIDPVMISAPDHWHVPISMEALKAGKDVSCEKPLARSIGEGRRVLILEHGGPIGVQGPLQRWQEQGLAMLGAEQKMNVQFGERLTHEDSPGAPLQGWRFEAGSAS